MIWKICPRFSTYEVSEDGKIRRGVGTKYSLPKHALLTPRLHGGYRIYTLWSEGRAHTVYAYRMVAEAFLGDPPFDGAEACHNDGDKSHDHFSNLRWGTHKDNMSDLVEHGGSPRGERNASVKLNEDQVLQIRRRLGSGETQQALADDFQVSQSLVSLIKSGKLWGHLVEARINA